MIKPFKVNIPDKTLEEIQDAYRTHFKLPPETKVIKRDLNKLVFCHRCQILLVNKH